MERRGAVVALRNEKRGGGSATFLLQENKIPSASAIVDFAQSERLPLVTPLTVANKDKVFGGAAEAFVVLFTDRGIQGGKKAHDKISREGDGCTVQAEGDFPPRPGEAARNDRYGGASGWMGGRQLYPNCWRGGRLRVSGRRRH